MLRFAYLHGFASSPAAHKASQLVPAFAARGIALERPNLNVPSFAKLSYSAILEALDAQHRRGPEARWCLIGSSMGGYLAARFAELHPGRVHRLLLLCPGFSLVSRWPHVFGQDAFEGWQRDRVLAVPDASGTPQPLHWGFVEDAKQHPAAPRIDCDCQIVHGRADDIVPLSSSRAYAESHPHVRVHEVDDDHGLVASLPRIRSLAMEGWFAGQAKRFRYHWDFHGPDREETGRHFHRHLDEFLARESLDHLVLTSTASARPGHFSAYCDAPVELESLLRQSLSPQRKTHVPAPTSAVT